MKSVSATKRGKVPARPDTRKNILDAAEGIFAARGYHATSLRAVTRAARANLAAVHYHFGSKQALLEAVLARRLTPLNAQRQAHMQALPADAGVAEILRAFIAPTLAFRDASAGARHFIAIVGRALAEPDEKVRTIFLAQMHELLTQLQERLAGALPHLDRQTLSWRLFFALGTVAHAMRLADRFPAAAFGVDGNLSTEVLTERLTGFVAAGIEGQDGPVHA